MSSELDIREWLNLTIGYIINRPTPGVRDTVVYECVVERRLAVLVGPYKCELGGIRFGMTERRPHQAVTARRIEPKASILPQIRVPTDIDDRIIFRRTGSRS